MRLCSMMLTYAGNKSLTNTGTDLDYLQKWYEKQETAGLQNVFCSFYETRDGFPLKLANYAVIENFRGLPELVYKHFEQKALGDGK